ncbi:hypothetical protein RsoM2USA_233 [Ralstonia phage RsoM2USA]|nr:hypothetical protein RsoM2USA_233 [Ralstonia phage RsoM2USA]
MTNQLSLSINKDGMFTVHDVQIDDYNLPASRWTMTFSPPLPDVTTGRRMFLIDVRNVPMKNLRTVVNMLEEFLKEYEYEG